MLKQKGNKFYIGKEEVTLLAIYLPDLFLETPQIFIFILIQITINLKW